MARRCWEVFEIQSNALATRMAALGKPKLILGVSGGLDSTHAALVAIQGLLLNNQSPKDLVCVTMPGLGTSSATRENAEALCFQLGALEHACAPRRVARGGGALGDDRPSDYPLLTF